MDPRGQTIKTFAWGLGNKTNNEAEWLALFQGLEMAGTSSISSLIVFGDSRQVIQKMRSGYRNGNIRCKRMARRITHSIEGKDYSFVHIL